MKVVWLGEALRELEEAALYYGDIDNELGERFSSAAEAAVAMIKARPEMSRKFDGEARKVRLESFPYAVVYWLDDDTLRILSVMHLHREPGYWSDRLQ